MVVHAMDGEFSNLTKMIRDIQIALLTTVDREGHFHARPVQTLGIERDLSLWFFTDIRSEKAFELSRDVRLGLGYADPKTRSYVAVSGTGRMLRDANKARQLWTVEQRAYYPHGPEDEHLVLLRVRIEHAEYWVAGGKIAHLLAALRARMTGTPATIVGRNARFP